MTMKNCVLLVATLLAPAIAPGVASAQVDVRLTVPSVRVRVAPPAARVEVPPPRPSPDRVWIEGHWARRGNETVWLNGVWATPPGANMVWEKPTWNQRGRDWYYTEGHWRYDRPSDNVRAYEPPRVVARVQADRMPPRVISERRPRAPFRGAVWIPGFWDWNENRYDWVAGHWSARPNHRQAWVPDRWKKSGRGASQRWVREEGHWRNR